MMRPHGHFHWNELMTDDVEAAKRFYGSTVGWTFDSMPMPDGTYWIAKAGDQAVGGIMDTASMGKDVQPQWFAYLNVDNVDQRVRALEANGGRVLREPWDIPGVGRIAIVEDGVGAVMGWMTAAPMAQG